MPRQKPPSNNLDQPSIQRLRSAIESVAPLPAEDWQMLLPYLEIRRLRKKAHFATQGKRAEEVGFILSGTLRQFYTHDGEEKTTYFFFENSLISAYISCITRQPSKVTIEALTPVDYIGFPYSRLKECFETSMAWQNFGRLIAEYLMMGLEERMVSLLLLSPEERYRQLLHGNKRKLLEQIPQHYLANYLGVTPVSLSRIRNRIGKT